MSCCGCSATRLSGRRSNTLLLSEFQAPGQDQTIDHDALDAQGCPVLFSYLPDIPRLNWYIEALIRLDRPDCTACFDFQTRALKASFDLMVSFLTISFKKIEKRFFQDWDTEVTTT